MRFVVLSNRDSLWQPIVWLMCVGGILVIFVYGRQIPLSFDESYNLNLAQTLARYNRYATHWAWGLQHFDPAISTGPHFMVWLGLWLKVAPPALESIRLYTGAAFFVSLLFVYHGIRVWTNPFTALIATLAFFCLPYTFLWGVSAQGDVWAIGWVFLSLYVLKKSTTSGLLVQQWAWAAISGVVLGLAVLTKSIVLLLVPALIVSAAVDGWQHASWSTFLREALPAGAAVVAFAGWYFLQKFLLLWFGSGDAYVRWVQATHARSKLMWKVVIFDPLSHPRRAWTSSWHEFGPFLIAFLLSLLVLLWYHRKRIATVWRVSSPFDRIVLIGCVTWFFWFYVLSGEQANNRHALLGYVFLLIFASEAIARLVDDSMRAKNDRLYRLVALGVLALAMGWGMFRGIAIDSNILRYGRTHHIDQAAVVDWVGRHISQETPIAGLGWFVPWDISFLAERLPVRADLYAAHPQVPTAWLIVIPEVKATGNWTDFVRQRLDAMGDVVFQQGGYQVYHLEVKK